MDHRSYDCLADLYAYLRHQPFKYKYMDVEVLLPPNALIPDEAPITGPPEVNVIAGRLPLTGNALQRRELAQRIVAGLEHLDPGIVGDDFTLVDVGHYPSLLHDDDTELTWVVFLRPRTPFPSEARGMAARARFICRMRVWIKQTQADQTVAAPAAETAE